MAMAAKRKRDVQDLPNVRPAPPMSSNDLPNYELGSLDHTFDHTDPNMDFSSMVDSHPGEEHDPNQQQHADQNASVTAAAAIAQYHTMTVPQSTEQAFMKEVADMAAERPTDSSNSAVQHRTSSFGGFELDGSKDPHNSNGEMSPSGAGGLGGPKPAVGSDEWHKVRRDNHKEVERRRRETINEGINELAKIVPGCEKNKGSILQRAVSFITQLKDNESQNIEKWTLEKLLTEQAISELSSSCDKLKAECQRAWTECEKWKKAARNAGVPVPDVETETTGVETAES